MSSVFINKPVPQVTPDFDKFASTHPSIGQKVGSPKRLRAGFEQQYQNATAYGAFGSPPKEVHGAIRDRFVQFGGPDGWLGYPLTDETATPDGEGRFNHFENGSIYWHPTTGAFEVHGAIRDRWAGLGHERAWLGYPTSDEAAFDDGRVSIFQHGAVYWWPDTGALAMNDVIVHYTGLHCFGETDADSGSDSDEPYATLGVAVPGGQKQVFQTKIYGEGPNEDGVDSNEGYFDVIELYRGTPRGLIVNSILQEHSGGDTNASRAVIAEAVEKGGQALATAATQIPVVGPVFGPAATLALKLFKEEILGALNGFLESTLGFADRPLGSDVQVLTAKQMIVLAMRPEGHAQFGPIPWRFETPPLSRFGATYKLYFNVSPA